MIKKRIFALLTGAAMLLTGCNSNANTAVQNLEEITVVLDWYPNALHSFLYQADKQGYFKDEGIKINIQSPSDSNDALTMVAAEKADIGIYYQQDVIQARAEQNVPVKCIGAIIQSPLNVVLSLEEKNITQPSDLIGKTVGYPGNQLSEALIKSIMKNAGANPNDVELINVGFDLMASMTTNKVDATIGCYVNHEVPQMEKEGFNVNYFFPHDFGVPQYYDSIFVSNDKMINEKPDVLKGFLNACKKGFEDFKNSPDTVLQTLLDNQNEENFPLDEEVEKKSAQTLLPLMETENSKFLTQTEECWQNNIDWLYNEGIISKKIEVSDVMINLQ